MGTRNLTCAVIDGQFKIAQYGQWDGQPTGQGEVIREFLARDGLDMDRLKKNVRACTFLTEAEMEALNDRFVAEMTAIENAKMKGGAYEAARAREEAAQLDPTSLAYLSRNTGGRILEAVYAAPRALSNQIAFAGDSLFCEWAYVVDLDQDTLEIYKGFNDKGPVPAHERFAFLNPERSEPFVPAYEGAKQYFPVELCRIIPLSDLEAFDMAALGDELYPEEAA